MTDAPPCALPLPADAFGDPFLLESLPLARPAVGYGVQTLGTDTLLDRRDGAFRPIRTAGLQPVFESFAAAHEAAADWLLRHGVDPEEHRLSIVPLGYDALLERHVLIYGVLHGRP